MSDNEYTPRIEFQRRAANIPVARLAQLAAVDRRKLGIILAGLTDAEIARLEEVLRAHA